MLTAGNLGTFKRGSAEVPHQAGAIALTNSAAQVDSQAIPTQSASQVDDIVDGLVDRAKAGDRAALDELLDKLRPRAMAAALRVLHDRDDAEDAVQDAFLKVWRSLAAFEGRSSFSTWIHRIVTNSSLDLLRKSTGRTEFVEQTERQDDVAVTGVEATHEETPESELGNREIEKLVRLAVAALPPSQRQVIELREFEDRSYQEMADMIRCPIGTVMSRLHHARHRLESDLPEPLGGALELYAA
jgi:RNA polymerase sigma-70 factor, ECF subfamily